MKLIAPPSFFVDSRCLLVKRRKRRFLLVKRRALVALACSNGIKRQLDVRTRRRAFRLPLRGHRHLPPPVICPLACFSCGQPRNPPRWSRAICKRPCVSMGAGFYVFYRQLLRREGHHGVRRSWSYDMWYLGVCAFVESGKIARKSFYRIKSRKGMNRSSAFSLVRTHRRRRTRMPLKPECRTAT